MICLRQWQVRSMTGTHNSFLVYLHALICKLVIVLMLFGGSFDSAYSLKIETEDSEIEKVEESKTVCRSREEFTSKLPRASSELVLPSRPSSNLVASLLTPRPGHFLLNGHHAPLRC